MELHCLRNPVVAQPMGTMLRRTVLPARAMRAMPVQRPLAVPSVTRAFNGQALRSLRGGVVPPMRRSTRRLLPVSMAHSAVPPERGLYNPTNDRDACGVGFVGEFLRSPCRPDPHAEHPASPPSKDIRRKE